MTPETLIWLLPLPPLLAFFLIDMLWLGLVARSFYQKHLGSLLTPNTNWLAAIIFYLLFIAGILIFVVVPSLPSGTIIRVALLGALFGLITYATYDLTNLLPGGKIDETVLDELETRLIAADVGIETTEKILAGLRGKVARKELANLDALLAALRQSLLDIVAPVSRPLVASLFVSSVLLSVVSWYTTQQGMALYLSPWFSFLASLGVQSALVLVAWLRHSGCTLAPAGEP